MFRLNVSFLNLYHVGTDDVGVHYADVVNKHRC